MNLTFCFLSILIPFSYSLTDLTAEVFGGDNHEIIAAFGDYNADKHTDIFAISQDGSTVYVYLADQEEKKFSKQTVLPSSTFQSDSRIVGIVPADFDGDLQMDLLVCIQNKSQTNVSPRVFWASGGYLILPDMVDQPLVLDENADMIPDLMGEKKPGQRFFWIFSADKTFKEKKFPGDSNPPLRVPQSSSFVDINSDLTADLCVVSVEDEVTQVEFWLNQDGKLKKSGENVKLEMDSKPKIVGQFTFADMDGDLTTDILVPVCFDEECVNSSILLYHGTKWVKLPVSLHKGDITWNFIPPTKTQAPPHLSIPITLRVGDFNLDGYPDLLAVLGNATGSLHTARIIENVACGGGCGGFSRTFAVDFDTMLEGPSDIALLPAFFDLFENGILDIIVSSVDSSGTAKISVMQHKFVDDACFVKVMVVSGLCKYNCPKNREPYGVNQYGPAVRYKTVDLKGEPQTHAATQLSQSAYLPLQLPYCLFGLGQTPNFIEALDVGIPTNTSTLLTRSWTSVIPNSQLLVIPYPVNDPSSWTNRLFVMPSRLMLLTGAALLGTCGFIAGIVGILHWRDKIEDKKEKRQEAQKFHFDAM